jgi:energy-coupling factor transport system substrate-specific component
MFTAGWAGLSAGWLRRIQNIRLGKRPIINTQQVGRSNILVLCVFGFAWGLLYGAIINVYFWPFAGGSIEETWSPGIGLRETLTRYAAFYVVTSLAWDLARAVGNVALIIVLGAPMIKTLERFRRRFNFELGGAGEPAKDRMVKAGTHA